MSAISFPWHRRRPVEVALAQQAARHADEVAKLQRQLVNLRAVNRQLGRDVDTWKARARQHIADRVNEAAR